MPMHDWTRVTAGTFHDFHNGWITHLKEALNSGLLPEPYYALSEQSTGDISPDVLALRVESEESSDGDEKRTTGSTRGRLLALAESPPEVQIAQEAKSDLRFYLARRRTLVIRHVSGDRVVATIEILSPANKHSDDTIERFLDKVVAALREGVHVMIVDPFPPSAHDPMGIHGAVWTRLMAGEYERPGGKPLTLVSYRASSPLRAYVEPFAVGSPLTDMPLFVTASHYVPVPLETTYEQAWAGVPGRWRRVIESA